MSAMTSGPAASKSSPDASRRNRRAVPTIVFHGDQDAVVHPSNGKAVHVQARRTTRRTSASVTSTPHRSSERRISGWLEGRGFTRTSQTKDGISEAELWIVHGAGHAWTGGSPDGTYTDTVGPDASREMMRFFLLHRLDAEMLQN